MRSKLAGSGGVVAIIVAVTLCVRGPSGPPWEDGVRRRQRRGGVPWQRVRSCVGSLLVLTALLVSPTQASAVALTGQVMSREEGPMEGVLVSAKRADSTITITVVSDAHGRYTFPRAKLEPGSYLLKIRAAGYDLNDPGFVDITSHRTTHLDLKLRKTQDLGAQLSNQEWLLSTPGTEEQKRRLLFCVGCHTLERAFRTDYNAADFNKVIARMSTYHPVSTPLQPQIAPTRGIAFPPGVAEYLSTVNLSSVAKWQYALKPLPRPSGKATRVIITEYDLPRAHAMPHDVVPDSEGMVWYSDFGRQYLGWLDPRTGKVVEYAVPLLKAGFPTGSHDLGMDRDGNPWVAMLSQGAIAMFDRRREKFQTWSYPTDSGSRGPGVVGVRPQFRHVDGKVWALAGTVQRLDVQSGMWLPESLDVFRDFPKDVSGAARPHAIYDIMSDSQNNCYFTDLRGDYIGKVDAKTLKVTAYAVPTSNSFPRRGHFDKQDRLWFAEYQSSKIAMFDPRTEGFQEWAMPHAFSWPYDVVLDKNGTAWTAGMISDRVSRLNTKTGEFIEYLLPRFSNIRFVDVDSSTDPVTFWAGNAHGASIIKVEPLD